jgi:predicted Zn finger-like uncharacterized protein
MNNACPSCGAVYAVAAKDIGRKIKCKKCGSALMVADSGLVIDAPVPPPPPAAAVVEDDGGDFETGDEVVTARGKKGKKSRDRDDDRRGGGAGDILAKIGGIPTILFGLGVFLVIWFSFMEPIGNAAIDRASMSVQKIDNEKATKLKKVLPKGKKMSDLTADELKKFEEDSKKINEDYEKQAEAAREEAQDARIDNVRSKKFDKYGQMFGFMFLAFGCIGYLRSDQPLVLRIVAGVILAFMMMIVFATVGSGGCGSTRPPLPTGG